MTASEELKSKVIFNSDDYMSSGIEDLIFEDLDCLLSETIVKSKGEIVGWMFLSKRNSHYGSISNHGKIGYRKVDKVNLVDAVLSVEADSIIIKDDDGILKVNYYDHDGSHCCTVKPIVKSRVNAIESKLHDFDKLIEYVKTMPSVKIKQNVK